MDKYIKALKEQLKANGWREHKALVYKRDPENLGTGMYSAVNA